MKELKKWQYDEHIMIELAKRDVVVNRAMKLFQDGKINREEMLFTLAGIQTEAIIDMKNLLIRGNNKWTKDTETYC